VYTKQQLKCMTFFVRLIELGTAARVTTKRHSKFVVSTEGITVF